MSLEDIETNIETLKKYGDDVELITKTGLLKLRVNKQNILGSMQQINSILQNRISMYYMQYVKDNTLAKKE